MNVVWFSWKDISHPESGGAETVSHEIMLRMVRDGHSVTLITSGYKGSGDKRTHKGIETFYTGGRYSVYIKASLLYRKKLRKKVDLVVDEMNTLPFFAALYTKAPKKVLLAYQLAREVWFYQMIFPLSIIGYIFEPIMLRVIGKAYNLAITESLSSKKDMERHGIANVNVFRVGMAMDPVSELSKKRHKNIILSLGSVRPMKRTLEAVKAFEAAHTAQPELRLVIAGDISSNYAKKVLEYIARSSHKNSITVAGRVSTDKRLELMREAGVIIVTSVKEGWGLIVTEANSQGTPAIAYDVDGLRDSVKDLTTGLITPNNQPELMGKAILDLLNSNDYETIRLNAWKSSFQYTFDNSYADFIKVIDSKTTAK